MRLASSRHDGESNVAEEQTSPAGPDLTQGVLLSDFTGQTLSGHVGDLEVLLVRAGAEVFAIDPHCSHYHDRSRRESWSATASAALGTTPASICTPGKLRVRRR